MVTKSYTGLSAAILTQQLRTQVALVQIIALKTLIDMIVRYESV